jgi:hypothetical protein
VSRNTKTKGHRPANISGDLRLSFLTPQATTVIRHLADTGTITQREALLDHSVQSLTRRITELRDHGWNIDGQWKRHPVTGQILTPITTAIPTTPASSLSTSTSCWVFAS